MHMFEWFFFFVVVVVASVPGMETEIVKSSSPGPFSTRQQQPGLGQRKRVARNSIVVSHTGG